MSTPPPDIASHRAVEDIARTSYRRLVAYLASVTGDLAAAEDAPAEAFLAALRTWPERGVPTRPDSWLVTAARRSIIDGGPAPPGGRPARCPSSRVCSTSDRGPTCPGAPASRTSGWSCFAVRVLTRRSTWACAAR